ncbi:MAG TPA: four helix bundle protein [Gemmatimonadaceae bacterium]
MKRRSVGCGGASSAIGDQMSRASNSIPRNIAEGCGYDSDRRLAKYLRHALGSTDELQNDLEALHRRRLLRSDRVHLLADANLVARKLRRFIDTLAHD